MANCECLIIANYDFFQNAIITLQSALIVYTHMCTTYVGAIITIAVRVKCWNVIKTVGMSYVAWDIHTCIAQYALMLLRVHV